MGLEDWKHSLPRAAHLYILIYSVPTYIWNLLKGIMNYIYSILKILQEIIIYILSMDNKNKTKIHETMEIKPSQT